MAVDSGYERSRKRRKKPKRKLLAGEHVEVLYSDEGLRGSWHTGIVVDCGERIRLVEYTNLLSEDNCSKLKESIPVSAAIEGLSGKPLKYHRGHIRPLPPHYEIHESEIKYGLCVDALVDDAWWEGVVFDRAEGSKERLIFFPDQGDQQILAVDLLRLTQEWEEISGHWKPRGKWLLLEVLQTFEQEEELPVSVREIWFDLRTTVAFSEKIGVWIFGSHSTWNALVSELIHELRSVVLGLFPSRQLIAFPTCSGSVSIPMKDFPSLGGIDVPKDDDVRNTNLAVTLNNSLSPRSLTLDDHPVSDSSSYERHAYNSFSYIGTKNMNPEGSEGENSDMFAVQESNNDYCGLENSIPPVTVNCCPIIKASETCKETKYQEDTKCGASDNHLTRKDYSAEARVDGRKNLQAGESWKPFYVKAAYYPEAVKIYGEQQLRQFMVDEKLCIVRHKVMQHLTALGWIIETRPDKLSSRIRYRTPEGKSHYSLRTACHELLQGQLKKKKKHGNDNHTDADCGSTDYANFHSADQKECILKSSKIRSEESGLHAGLCRSIDTNLNKTRTEKSLSLSKMIDSGIIEEVTSSVFEEHRHSTDHAMSNKEKLLSNGSEMVSPVYDDLEPGSFPEAVVEYKMHLDLFRSKSRHVFSSDFSLTRLNARKHLKFMGWKFWIKGRHRNELFITSPTGKPFRSLYTACEEYLREGLKNCSAEASLKRLQSISATSSKFSESTELGVDTSVLERNRKSKRRKVLPHCTSSAFATLSDRRLNQSFDHSSVPEKSKRNKGGQPLLRQGHEIVSSLSTHGAKSRKRPQQDMLQTPSQRVPRTVLSLLIDNDMILPRQKVCYIRKRDGKILMEGSVTRDGIKCKCCKMVYTLSNFEAHAGSTYRRPAASIFLPDGRSLLECQTQMIHRKKPKDFRRLRLKGDCSQYKSDSVCSVCHDGGSLVLCDHCPSSFHLSCVGLENVPEGKWFCPSCRCGICGRSEFNSDTEQFTEMSILYCDQCEREYHVGCMKKRQNKSLSSCPVGNWFCSQNCSKIFHHLRQLVGISRPTAVDGLSWTILRSSRENGIDSLPFDAETMTEHDSKLCVALDVLHECFVSIIEPRTQSDFVADLLFNKESELRRLNFYGFYTMLLEKGDELVSVATFRVYGDKVAEMPLVGTRVKYRRQGMCRLLINELEKVLSDLGVESLLLPAVPQLLQTWTTSFGFSKMTSPERLSLLEHTVLYFQETTMCQKSLRSVSIPVKPKGDCKEFMDISASPVEKKDSEFHINVSEAVGMVEPNNALPLVDADYADETRIEVEYSPVSTCINSTGQTEPESGANGRVNVAPHKRTRNKVTQDNSPVLALESPPNLNAKILKYYYDCIGKDNSMGQPFIKNIYNGGASTFKYFYKRRMSSNN